MNYSTDYKTHAKDIDGLFRKTFSDSEGIEEGALIGDLVTQLMTETPEADLRVFMRWEHGTLVGCICFSRLIYLGQPHKIFMMSPVAVSTEHQRKGIGQSLISYGLSELKLEGVDIAVTYGDPAFYKHVGFAAVSQDTLPPPHPLQQPEGWIAQTLNETPLTPLRGPASCVSAFNDPALW